MPTKYIIEYLQHGVPILVIDKRHVFFIPRVIHELWSGRQKDKTMRVGLDCTHSDTSGGYVLNSTNLTITLNGETIVYDITPEDDFNGIQTKHHVSILADYYADEKRYHFSDEYMKSIFPGKPTQRYVARGFKSGYSIVLADLERNTLIAMNTAN